MITKYRISIILIAILLTLFMFFGNNRISEAQSARFYLKWTVECAKGESITIKPKYEQSIDWTDSYTGVVEKIVPLAMSCKTSAGIISKTCNGYYITRASRLDPLNKTNVACYAVQ